MSFANNLVLYENFLFDQRYDKQVHYTNKHTVKKQFLSYFSVKIKNKQLNQD